MGVGTLWNFWNKSMLSTEDQLALFLSSKIVLFKRCLPPNHINYLADERKAYTQLCFTVTTWQERNVPSQSEHTSTQCKVWTMDSLRWMPSCCDWIIVTNSLHVVTAQTAQVSHPGGRGNANEATCDVTNIIEWKRLAQSPVTFTFRPKLSQGSTFYRLLDKFKKVLARRRAFQGENTLLYNYIYCIY